jgi:glyoxylase-like metal-dependent hydrolase (beta-lactamase superfamily II)
MKIHALTTGTVRLKRAFLHARTGPRRQLDLFLPGPWSDPVPIHCWAIEHAGRVVLVDTGETADVRDIPFARFDVAPEQELPNVLTAAGLSVDDVDSAVVTHLHGDHMDGGVHLRCPVLVHDNELQYARKFGARILQRLFRQPVPEQVDFRPIALDAGPFGAFEQSRPLGDDGRIVAVGTPGHTVGHISVICIDDEGRHVMLAGDATDTLEQLQARRPDAVSPKPAVAVSTMERILEHGRRHPTVYLPAHDLETVARLDSGTTL